MANVQNIFVNGRMDSDTDYSLLDNKGYVYALNLRPKGYGKDGSLHTIKGSISISNYSENGTMTTVGMYAGENNKLYTFLARKDGLSKIVETDVITKESRLVIEDAEHLRFDLLRWKDCSESERKYLLSVNQVEDHLYISNEVWENPRVIDVTEDYSDGFDLQDISLGKKPPALAPRILTQVIANSNSSENQRNRFVSFAYRYRYRDGSYSPFSFYSDVAFREGNVITTNDKRENTGMVNQWSGVNISINTGDFRVRGIEVIAREHGTNNGYIIYTADKDTTEYQAQPITDNQELTVHYNFSTNYTMADETIIDLIYSNIPKYPKTQDYIGSRIFYANYKEGFDMKDVNGKNINIDIDYTLRSSEVDFSKSKKTLVSLFSYKVGVVYYDEYNEASTVLLNNNDIENDTYVPFENRTKINKILAKVNHDAPAWAKKFKFVVQHQKLNYDNIYSGYIRKIADSLYILLDSDNINKIKVGKKIFLTANVVSQYTELTVRDVKFIKTSDIPLDIEGTYAIIEGASGVDIYQNEGNSGVVENTNENLHEHHDHKWDELAGTNVTVSGGNLGDIKINDRIKIELSINPMVASGTSNYQSVKVFGIPFLGDYNFTQTIIASNNYSNIYELVANEFKNPLFNVQNNNTSITLTANDLLEEFAKNNFFNSYSGGYMKFLTKLKITLIRGNAGQFIRTQNKETQDTYFYESLNTFSVVNGKHIGADAEGLFDIGFYNGFCWGNGMESYKIKDDFNGRVLDWRFRPNGVDTNGYGQVWKKNDITYSSLYNGDLKINQLNLFNPRLTNWKELPKEYGEIQRIISTDGDITVFCNDKIILQYYGKSILADLTGNENVAIAKDVLGDYQVLPYTFGTQNPESVTKSVDGLYWVDKKRTRYLYKTGRQIFELNPEGSGHHNQGVKEIRENNYFQSYYNEAHGEVFFGLNHNGAIVFNPQAKGFSHYYDYQYDFAVGMDGKSFTAHRGVVYQDDVSDEHNKFAGNQYGDAKLIYVVNPEFNSDKVFKAMMLNSNTAWNVDIKTNLTATEFPDYVFAKKESFYFSEIYRDNSTAQNSRGIGVVKSIDANTLTFSSDIGTEIATGDTLVTEGMSIVGVITNISENTITISNPLVSVGEYVFAEKQRNDYNNPDGAPMRGKWMEVTLTQNNVEPIHITSVTTELIQSKL